MDSINRHRVRQRVSRVFDTAMGAQATSKAMKEYTKTLEKSVDVHRESMRSAADFNKEIGSI